MLPQVVWLWGTVPSLPPRLCHSTVESGLIQTVANVVTRMTIPSWAAQPGSLAN